MKAEQKKVFESLLKIKTSNEAEIEEDYNYSQLMEEWAKKDDFKNQTEIIRFALGFIHSQPLKVKMSFLSQLSSSLLQSLKLTGHDFDENADYFYLQVFDKLLSLYSWVWAHNMHDEMEALHLETLKLLASFESQDKKTLLNSANDLWSRTHDHMNHCRQKYDIVDEMGTF